jgi:paraquat-inducible protein B
MDNGSNNSESGIGAAVVEKSSRFSIVWLLPLIAVAIGGWLAYKGIVEGDIIVHIQFDTGAGLTVGKTEVKYEGISIGVVKEISLDSDLKGVIADVGIVRKAKQVLKAGTQFWLVKPDISFRGVSGLETLMSGTYIATRLGDGEYCIDFTALPEPPPLSENEPGLHISVQANDLGSINAGAPVHYRKIQVGDVQKHSLNPEEDGVSINVYIQKEYAHLVRKNTRFWNCSGITVSGGLDGIDLRTESLASIIAGGIAFVTPESEAKGEPAENGDVFKLYKDYKAASTGIPIKITFESAEGLVKGKTQVMYKGVSTGILKEIELKKKTLDGVICTFMMPPTAGPALNEYTRFWLVKPTISASGLSGMDALFKGKYVEADFKWGGKRKRNFVALEKPPAPYENKPGLYVTLKSPEPQSLDRGKPVFYRKIRAGSVQDVYMDKKYKNVLIRLHIEKPYDRLVKSNTRFWNAGGISVKGGLKGIEMRMESIEAVLSGGIAFFNPEGKGRKVKKGHKFILYSDYEKAHEVTKKDKGLALVLTTPQLGSVKNGVKVNYREIHVGTVTECKLADTANHILVYVNIESRYAPLVRRNSKFWNSSGIDVDFSLFKGAQIELDSIESLLEGGIAFATPDNDVMGDPVADGAVFELHEKSVKKWFGWNPVIRLNSQAGGSN